MLNFIFETITGTTMTVQSVLICTVASFVLGVGIAYVYMFRNQYNKNFVVTLALMPVMIQIVIMLVNGNLGTSVAIVGAFSLIRFRSIAGTARDIGTIFFAMAIGLATGMGYISFAVFIAAIVGLMSVILNAVPFGVIKQENQDLKIVIPETLDFEGVFDDVLKKYTNEYSLNQVRTTNLGSLFELSYVIQLKDKGKTKEFIDELRVRNGNLNIICSKAGLNREML